MKISREPPTKVLFVGNSEGQSGFLKRALAQTCLRPWYQVRFFLDYLWAFLGPCVRGRGRPWYGTSAQPESHFTCSSPRDAPRVAPSTSLLNQFLGILRGSGEGRGGAPSTVPLQNPEVTSRHVSDNVKRHLSRRHLSVLNLLFNFIFDSGCTREKEIRFH